MNNPKNKLTINLGRKSRGVVGQFVTRWVINFGRIIIVATELILLIALIARFVIDYQLSDLHEIIKKREGYLLSIQNIENKYRDLQERLGHSRQFTTEITNRMSVFNTVTKELLTEEFSITKLGMSSNTIILEGSSSNVFALDDLIKKLKAIELIETIGIDEVKSVDSKISFGLHIALKQP